ncbi:MAG: MazG family protein [Streptosporangiaceae bacterium]
MPDASDGQVEGARLLDLVVVMDRLRTGCPWDARQTHESLAPYLLEETYEAIDALDGGDPGAFREELGDVLLQVVFHARVAAERADGTGYTIDDVADGIIEKLTRRHPHVFGDVTVSGAEEVKANWDAIKAAERQAASGEAGSILDGIPLAQPALSLATALQRRAERAGAPAELADLTSRGAETGAEPIGPGEVAGPARTSGGSEAPAVDETSKAGEASELHLVPGAGGADAAVAGEAEVSEIGAELFALADRARAAGLDPELELRAAARTYRDRVQAWEQSQS